MKTRNTLIAYFVLVLVAMTWVSWYASTAPTITSLAQYAAVAGKEGINVLDGFVTVCSEPWPVSGKPRRTPVSTSPSSPASRPDG